MKKNKLEYSTTITISLPLSLVSWIDERSSETDESRSSFIKRKLIAEKNRCEGCTDDD